MRKNFSNEDLDYGTHQLFKNNIIQAWLLIVGYPTETDDDFNQTLDLLKRQKKYNSNGMIQLNITLPFQLNDDVPLVKEQKYLDQFQWDPQFYKNSHYRYFWTTANNMQNTFETRYNRFKKIVDYAYELDYKFFWAMDMKKHFGELEDLKKIYDQHRKKVIYFS